MRTLEPNNTMKVRYTMVVFIREKFEFYVSNTNVKFLGIVILNKTQIWCGSAWVNTWCTFTSIWTSIPQSHTLFQPRWQIGISHLSIFGIVVHDRCYIPHYLYFSVIFYVYSMVSFCFCFAFMVLDSNLTH